MVNNMISHTITEKLLQILRKWQTVMTAQQQGHLEPLINFLEVNLDQDYPVSSPVQQALYHYVNHELPTYHTHQIDQTMLTFDKYLIWRRGQPNPHQPKRNVGLYVMLGLIEIAFITALKHNVDIGLITQHIEAINRANHQK